MMTRISRRPVAVPLLDTDGAKCSRCAVRIDLMDEPAAESVSLAVHPPMLVRSTVMPFTVVCEELGL
jgi:hypothetical protein